MTRRFETILIPVDFSAHALEAFLYAASLAKRYAATMLILHTISHEVQTYATHRHLEHLGMPHRVFPLLGLYTETLEEPP